MINKATDTLPPTLAHQLAALGLNLKLARKRRKWSVAKVRGDIGCAKGTLEDAEKGKPSVNFGVYVQLLELYGFKVDWAGLTSPNNDLLGQALSGPLAGKPSKPKVTGADF